MRAEKPGILDFLKNQPVYIQPNEVAYEFPYKHETRHDIEIAAEKAGSDGDTVANAGQEREKRKPVAVLAYFFLKPVDFFFFYAHVFFYPFYFAQQAKPVAGQPAEPVAERGRNDASPRVKAGKQHAGEYDLGTEREYGCRKKCGQEQSEITKSDK